MNYNEKPWFDDEYWEYRDFEGYHTWQCEDMTVPDVVLFRHAFSEVTDASNLLKEICEEVDIDWCREDHHVILGDCTIDQLLGVLRLNVQLARKLNNAVSALDKVNDSVVTAQEQARKVEQTISALER
jgi:hypothetical protein